jgi:poly[(R)-3-hydroxyalkanoate] polymerase subunit PhaC
MRLLAFAGWERSGPALLLVPGPIKRSYIFDLVAHASVARACCERGFPVFLVEWTDPAAEAAEFGLEDFAHRLLLAARNALTAVRPDHRVVLIGHSLGGTLVALHAARHPRDVAAVVLLESPLAFDDPVDAFAPWLKASPDARRLLAGASTVPGSELSLAAVAAAPEAFFWHRWGDALSSVADPPAHDLHLRVLRWTLDEMALPAPLLRDVLQRLYREDRFRTGELVLAGEAVGLALIRAPLLAVVEEESRVVPAGSLAPALAATASPERRVLTYESEAGVMLSHVGVLVGKLAHERLWPQIFAWIEGLSPAFRRHSRNRSGLQPAPSPPAGP